MIDIPRPPLEEWKTDVLALSRSLFIAIAVELEEFLRGTGVEELSQ